jgi:hypothetical protein
VLVASLTGAASGGPLPPARVSLGTRSVSETTWIADGVEQNRRFRLSPPDTLSWFVRYQRPWENHVPEWRAFMNGRYGLKTSRFALEWKGEGAPEPALFPVTRARPCPRWRAPKPVTVLRYAGERERLALVDCDGAVAPDVIDRLSSLARPPDAPRPALPLPEEPSADAANGEWAPGVRLLEPRLVWVLVKIAEAFPQRAIVIMSGYRPDSHSSLHRVGRALDLAVQGVSNEDLFDVCRTLSNVGCGYYPNGAFVHFDVRPWGSPRVRWVDDARPGEPSHYLDGWPGVIEPGSTWVPD